MSRKSRFSGLTAIVTTLVVAGSPVLGIAQEAPGGGGGGGTGDVFSDLVVILRDVNGVPLLTDFIVDGETGPTTEWCVQPVSYTQLPGLTDPIPNPANGLDAYLIPLMGELPALPLEDEVEVCDPQTNYAMYVAEAELERLNMVRQPDAVKEQKLGDVEIKLATADTLGLDGAGRITVDGVAIDAAPEHAAIYSSLMATGTIPGLDVSPAQVGGFDAWMLAAAAIGTTSGKYVPLDVDSVQYFNRISDVPANYVPSVDWTVDFLRTTPPGAEQFVDYSGFSYTRADVYTGCATWLDVPNLKWMVSPISGPNGVVDFADLPPIAVGGTVNNVAGFAQLADDVRAGIVYYHENEVVAGFYMDSVFENTCTDQLAALQNPAVQIGSLPEDIIQTDVVSTTASLFMPWAGTTVNAAQLQVTIDADQEFTNAAQVSALATAGLGTGGSVAFELTPGGALVGQWGPALGFPVEPGYSESTTFDVTVASGAPVGTYTVTLDLIDLGTSDKLATHAATTNVMAATMTALWTSVTDYAAQGTFLPITARTFNPDLGQLDSANEQLQITLDAPEDFILANQVAAWSESVAMPFTLVSGNLVGTWPTGPLAAGEDVFTTWYLNVADGAPLGWYDIDVEIVGGSAVVDTASFLVGAAAVHGGDGGGGGGGGGGGDDGTLPPVAAILSAPSIITNDSSATFTLAVDQGTAELACSLDGAVATLCTSPVTYDDLSDGDHTFAVYAVGSGKVGPTAIRTWTVDTMAPALTILTAPPATTTDTSATFTFAATDAVAVLCALDGDVLDRCTSPASFSGLAVGTHTFTLASVDAAGNYSSATHRWTVAAAITPPLGLDDATRYIPLNPFRLFDTRVTEPGNGPKGVVGPDEAIDVQIVGVGNVPAHAVAVVMNLTVTDTTGPSFVSAYPKGASRPTVSALNIIEAGQTRSNLVTVPIGDDGMVTLYSLAGANLLADVAGYYVPNDEAVRAGRFVALTPQRAFDTRATEVGAPGPKGILDAGDTIDVQILGFGDVPAAGVSAVVINITGTEASAPGFLTAFPNGQGVPFASNVNLATVGTTAANLAIVPIGDDGKISIYSSGGAHALGDITGYITDATAGVSTSGLFVPVVPERTFDSRSSEGGPGFVPPEGTAVVQVAGVKSIPANAGAVVLNVAGVDSPLGFLTAFDTGADRPTASTVNFVHQPLDTRANAAMLPIGEGGTISFYTLNGSDILVDTSGYFLE